MKAPLFSILLPTKNRSEIVAGAIESALAQTCGDFELVISDNDDSETATRDVVARFGDPRIRYFRTSGKLAMHENWDSVLARASGEYVLVLEDKQRLTPGALASLSRVYQENPGALISYPFIIARGESIPNPPPVPRIRRFRAERVIEEFCRFSPLYYDIFPRGLTSCAPRALFEKVRGGSPTGMVFSYVNPDYSSAFMLLSSVPELLYVPENIIFIPHSVGRTGKYSNGLSSLKKEEQARRFYTQLPVTPADIIANVPVKTHWLWTNPVLYDFGIFYRRPGHKPKIDWVAYHSQCLHIVLIGKSWGGDMHIETAAIRASMRERGVWFSTLVWTHLGWRCARSVWFRFVNRFRY